MVCGTGGGMASAFWPATRMACAAIFRASTEYSTCSAGIASAYPLEQRPHLPMRVCGAACASAAFTSSSSRLMASWMTSTSASRGPLPRPGSGGGMGGSDGLRDDRPAQAQPLQQEACARPDARPVTNGGKSRRGRRGRTIATTYPRSPPCAAAGRASLVSGGSWGIGGGARCCGCGAGPRIGAGLRTGS